MLQAEATKKFLLKLVRFIRDSCSEHLPQQRHGNCQLKHIFAVAQTARPKSGRRAVFSDTSVSVSHEWLRDFTGKEFDGNEFLKHTFDEPSIYDYEHLQSVEVPDIPLHIEEKFEFDRKCVQSIAKIDQTGKDIIIKWLFVALKPSGKQNDIYSRLHQDSQGLPHLDRFIASKFLVEKNLDNENFGLQLQSYMQWCYNQGESPKGRVVLAMVGFRFYLEPARKKASLPHSLALHLPQVISYNRHLRLHERGSTLLGQPQR